jgi:hypothetical protein
MTTVGEMYAAYEAEEEARNTVLPVMEDVELEIVHVSVRETKKGDGLRLVPRFLVVLGENAGRMFYADSWTTTSAAKPFTFETLRNLGLTREELQAAESHEEIAAKLKGRRFVATVQQRPWNDRLFNTIPYKTIRAVEGTA